MVHVFERKLSDESKGGEPTGPDERSENSFHTGELDQFSPTTCLVSTQVVLSSLEFLKIIWMKISAECFVASEWVALRH